MTAIWWGNLIDFLEIQGVYHRFAAIGHAALELLATNEYDFVDSRYLLAGFWMAWRSVIRCVNKCAAMFLS